MCVCRVAYGDGDAHEDGRVVGVSGDGLRPVRLTELVRSRVGADLHTGNEYEDIGLYTVYIIR